MKTKIIMSLLGSAFGAVLAGAAVFAAYRGSLVFAGILIGCQAVAFAFFIWAITARQKAARTTSGL